VRDRDGVRRTFYQQAAELTELEGLGGHAVLVFLTGLWFVYLAAIWSV
jgi:hypothetical protein